MTASKFETTFEADAALKSPCCLAKTACFLTACMAYRKVHSKFSLETEGVLCQTSTCWSEQTASRRIVVEFNAKILRTFITLYYFRAGRAITSAFGQQKHVKKGIEIYMPFPFNPFNQKTLKDWKLWRVIIKSWAEMTNHQGSHGKLVNVSSQSLHLFCNLQVVCPKLSGELWSLVSHCEC